MGGDFFHSWTADNGVCWPRSLLPLKFPTARIMSWGYNSKVVTWRSFGSTASIQGHARGLLADVNHYRRTRVSYVACLQGGWSANYEQQAEGQKLIFVAHGIGGILVQAVSTRCSSYFDVKLITKLNIGPW
jgi:hypothetical protein